MREFFSGWRRKVGCVTLVMALLFAVAWIRGLYGLDQITVVAFRLNCRLILKNGRIGCCIDFQQTPNPLPASTGGWTYVRHQGNAFFYPITMEVSDWLGTDIGSAFWRQYARFGFAFGHYQASRYVCVVPYWSIVVPLTLVSAYLLLSKTRRSSPKQTTAPSPTTGV
jgi:hypothetical protein